MAAALSKVLAGGPSGAAATPAARFALLYAAAILLHVVWPPVFLPTPAFPAPPPWLLTGVVLAAGAVIHRPADCGRLLGLAIVQLVDVAYYLPVVPNHWLLTGIVSLAILGAAGVVALRAGPAGLQLGELYQTVTPPVRLSAVIFYFFTFFHKLNTDFLNPEVSCAVRFLEQTLAPFAPLGLAALPGVGAAVIGATLAVELLVAVGLAVPRWRAGACLLGAGFHLLLALDAPHIFYNFSAVMFAVLWVCLPASRAAGIARQPGGRGGRFHFLGGYALIVGLVWWLPTEAWVVAAFGFSGLWLAFALTLLRRAGLLGRYNVVRFAAAARRSLPCPAPRAPTEARPGRRSARVLLLVPALVLLNGLSPYLGLKTRTAWQMYSNLNLAAEYSNHVLVPYSLDVGGFLADAVHIVVTSAPASRAQPGRTGGRLTWFELRRYVAQHPDVWLAYTRPGHPPTAFGPAAQDPALTAPGLGVLGKLLIFRPVGAAQGGVCDW